MKLLAPFILALALSACSFLESRPVTAQLTVQYATIKVVESATVSKEVVLERVQQARTIVDGGAQITLAILSEEVRKSIGWENLDTADKMLLNAILAEAERRLAERIGEGVLDEDAKVTLNTLFDWIEQAVAFAS